MLLDFRYDDHLPLGEPGFLEEVRARLAGSDTTVVTFFHLDRRPLPQRPALEQRARACGMELSSLHDIGDWGGMARFSLSREVGPHTPR